MADMIHHEKYSIDRGHIHISFSLKRYADLIPGAQQWLGEQVLQGCRAVMPQRNSDLQNRSHTEAGGRQVIFPGPSARYLYMGYLMVDPVTRSAFAREGVKKVVTSKRLTYSREEAVSHWFDEAKARNGEAWVRGVKQYIRTGGAM